MAEPVKEDTNLDDFFAKKDKTKKKSKSRLTPADIETQMEKKLKKKSSLVKKKEKDSANSAQSTVLAVKLEEITSCDLQDDGEWKDVEEETEIDYSDLRIQNLKISSKEEEDKERQENFQSGEEGDERSNKDGPQGPWKSFQSSAPVAPVEPPPKETVVPAEPEKEAAKSTQKYVPPGARRAAAQQPGTGAGPGGRRKKVAPNFDSQDDFPSLAAALSEQGDYTAAEYEKVKGGGRQIEDPSNRHVKLSLGNKFGALEGKDS